MKKRSGITKYPDLLKGKRVELTGTGVNEGGIKRKEGKKGGVEREAVSTRVRRKL